MNIEAVFFDLDDTLFDRENAQHQVIGTIIDTFPNLFAGIQKAAVEAAFMESDRLTLLEYQAGLPIKKFRTRRTQIFLNILGISQKYGDDITNLYVKKYPAIYAPVQDAKNVIGHLTGKFRLGVISNGFPDVQYKKLETLQLKSFVDCVVLSEEIGAHKPGPEIFLHAVSLLNTVPAAAIHIGDSFENDVIGAKKAGLLSCWFNPLHKKPPVLGIKPDFEIQSLNEIYTCLISCFNLTGSSMKPTH